jgi:hypothetical protein
MMVLSFASVILGCKPKEDHDKNLKVANPDRLSALPSVELNVSALKGVKYLGVMFQNADSGDAFFQLSRVQQGSAKIFVVPGSKVPNRVRITWRDSDQSGTTDRGVYGFTGLVIGEEFVDVGHAIPQHVFQSLEVNPGGLRILFRMSAEGTYVGWDIGRIPYTCMSGCVSEFSEAGGECGDPELNFFSKGAKEGLHKSPS